MSLIWTRHCIKLTWPGVIFDCRPFDIFLKAVDLWRVDLGLAVVETKLRASARDASVTVSRKLTTTSWAATDGFARFSGIGQSLTVKLSHWWLWLHWSLSKHQTCSSTISRTLVATYALDMQGKTPLGILLHFRDQLLPVLCTEVFIREQFIYEGSINQAVLLQQLDRKCRRKHFS